jgi:hypothetical protein
MLSQASGISAYFFAVANLAITFSQVGILEEFINITHVVGLHCMIDKTKARTCEGLHPIFH